MANCPNCGASIKEGMTRCLKCGSTVAAPAPAAYQPPPAPQTPPPAPFQPHQQPYQQPQYQQPPHPQYATSEFAQRDPNLIYPSTPPKSPVLAGILTCLITGLGQLYLGQVGKGIALFCGAFGVGFVIGFCMAIIDAPMEAIDGMVSLALIAYAIFVIIDASVLAGKLKSGQPIGKWQLFFQSR